MAVVVLCPDWERRILAERRHSPGYKWDEVWDGVYVVPPSPDDTQQDIVGQLGAVFMSVLKEGPTAAVRLGINLSDREDDWMQNFREPDVVVFLQGSTARNLDTHWVGGPDFVVEVVSPGDWTRKKLPFYESIGTRELLLVDRKPWALELYRLIDGRLSLVGTSRPGEPGVLASAILPLTFRLVAGEGRPRIEVERRDGEGRWTI